MMTHLPVSYANAHDAIRAGNISAPKVVAWSQEWGVWFVYDPTDPPTGPIEPEFFCIALGKLPLPLSETAIKLLEQMVTL